MREYFTDCRDGEYYSGILGRRLGATSGEITRRDLWREALCQMAEDFFQFISSDGSLLCSKAHLDHKLRSWLYLNLDKMEIRSRLKCVLVNGGDPIYHVPIEDEEDYTYNLMSCPVCDRGFRAYRHEELPVCCGEYVIDYPGYIYGYGPYYDPSRVLTEARAEYLAAILYPGGTL